MNQRLTLLHASMQALIDEAKAIQATAEPSDADKARAKALPGEIAALKQEIEAAKALDAATTQADAFLNTAAVGISAIAQQIRPQDLATLQPARVAHSAPAVLSRQRSKHFASIPGMTRDEANRKAYAFGMFMLATTGNGPAMKWCAQNGYDLRAAHSESVNEDGGFLVPAEFENDLIDLREKFGIFRQFARNSPMASDTKSRPRRKGGLTAYFANGGDTVSESTAKWDRVNLVAKKLMVLTRVESELNEDSVLSLGDLLAKEIAYAFAVKEDGCGFVGDGTAAYGGIQGVGPKLTTVHGTDGGPGLVVGAGNAWSELTLANFSAVNAKLPEYADTQNVRWFCHRTFYYEVVEKLMLAAGGVTAAEIAAGRPPRFMGYDVVFAQAMPKTEANSQVPIILGDLALAADYGDRRQTTLLMSEHTHFSTDEIGLRGTERFDIVVHDVGDATDAGPIVGLITAAS